MEINKEYDINDGDVIQDLDFKGFKSPAWKFR